MPLIKTTKVLEDACARFATHAYVTVDTEFLRERGLKRLFLAGLATDFCVAFSALDARAAGFETYVFEDCCRAIDQEGSLAKAWNNMAGAGVKRISSRDLQ